MQNTSLVLESGATIPNHIVAHRIAPSSPRYYYGSQEGVVLQTGAVVSSRPAARISTSISAILASLQAEIGSQAAEIGKIFNHPEFTCGYSLGTW
jgi:hypothetical protein